MKITNRAKFDEPLQRRGLCAARRRSNSAVRYCTCRRPRTIGRDRRLTTRQKWLRPDRGGDLRGVVCVRHSNPTIHVIGVRRSPASMAAAVRRAADRARWSIVSATARRDASRASTFRCVRI